MVERTLGPSCVPSLEHAARWSTPIDVCTVATSDLPEVMRRAGYPVKLGLEIAGPKQGRTGALSHWQLARLAADGDSWARERWSEFYRATKGRRAVELDDRATRFAKTPLPDHGDGQDVPSELQRVTVPVDALELRALRQYERRHDRGVLGAIAQSLATAEDPRETVASWLDVVTRALRYDVEHVQAPRYPAPDPFGWLPKEARGPP